MMLKKKKKRGRDEEEENGKKEWSVLCSPFSAVVERAHGQASFFNPLIHTRYVLPHSSAAHLLRECMKIAIRCRFILQEAGKG